MGLFKLFKNKKVKELFSIASPLNGNIIPQNEIEDKVFVDEAMGKGVGILVEDKKQTLVAPISGVVTMIFPTKHAIGIRTDEGIEILIHIGINTVELNGEGFEKHIEAGQRVKRGEKLVTVDFANIKNKGFNTTTILLISNYNEFENIEFKYGNSLAGDTILEVKK